ncbi:hypothetical protein CTheo_6680 [Ceratobasidium theobromae]|uniref:DUF6534 domain-containing protein n=1 Tax=Ceratobasidium theobromae TaxID=1582974 RepID=A0A5N5QE31_9AGAM|nr:hypothetical protein CTheo_6680 [Ceratobasidium theobromae]
MHTYMVRAIAAAVSCASAASIVKDFARFKEFKVAAIIWLGLSAITDTAITCTLSCHLYARRTGTPKTNDAITRLVRLTVPTGLITTIWAIGSLVLYLAMDNNMHLLFQLPLCKLYTNGLMSTLNSRAFWDGGSDTSDDDYISEQRGRDMQGNQEPRAASGWGFSLKSMPPGIFRQPTTKVRVVSSTVVHREDGVELEEYRVANTKRSNSDDIERFALSRPSITTVPIAGVLSSGAASDSTHSRVSFEAK